MAASSARDAAVAFGAAAASLGDIDQPLADAASLVLGTAQPPRRSGRLAASGRAVGPRISYAAVHAMPVHFGTRYTPPRPWLIQARDTATAQVADTLTDGIRDRLVRALT